MKNKIYIKKKKLIIEVPMEANRYDYLGENIISKRDNIAGCIDNHYQNYADAVCGFVYKIDMSYKGKADQFSDFFYTYEGNEEDFEELCKKLNIDIVYA